MRIFFIGVIVGAPGRGAVRDIVPVYAERMGVDFAIANCENSASGRGVTPKIVEFLLGAGIDVLTSGNHIWDRPEIIPYIDGEPRLIRPANYPEGAPGRGVGVFISRGGVKVAVLNLCGKLFMDSYENPFAAADGLVEKAADNTPIVILDFHAEATSEKLSMGWYLDGRVSAVLGTHTHVQTADDRVLPGGTAYITDVGMTGSMDSVIGMDREKAMAKFLTLMPQRLEPATENVVLQGVLMDIDPESGRALGIERMNLREGGI